MPSFEALQAYFDEKQGRYIRYLCDQNKEPEQWDEGQQGRLAV